MRFGRSSAIGVFLILLIVSTVFLLIWINSGNKRIPFLSPAVIPSSIEDPSFTPDGYIEPLEVAQAGESKYSSRAYVRGRSSQWQSGSLSLRVGESVKDIQFPPQVQLSCLDEFVVNPNGERRRTSDLHLDVSRLSSPGVSLFTTALAAKFPAGSDMIVLVHVDASEKMTAYQVFGFGCNESE